MPLMRRLFAVLLVTQSLLIAAPPARAGEALAPAITATITVNTFADEWSDDNPQGAGTACSLREALDRVMNNVPTRGGPVLGATV